jgi:hypothetical protein
MYLICTLYNTLLLNITHTQCIQVLSINAKMLEFDFRNGPLRRKYDGLKYVLRSVEDITFEMSLAPPTPPVAVGNVGNVVGLDLSQPLAKRMRLEDGSPRSGLEAGVEVVAGAEEVDGMADAEVWVDKMVEAKGTEGETEAAGTEAGAGAEAGSEAGSEMKEVQETQEMCLDEAELDAIRARLDQYDQLREGVIKDSRDVQKLSKQVHTHTYTYIHVHIHTRTYTYTYIHIHTRAHTYTYIHVHIHTHTHTHTYIH